MAANITQRKFDYFDMTQRNVGILRLEEQSLLKEKCVAVIGLGGIGALQAILACKVGFGKVIAIDFDSYDVSNLNRQELADINVIGMKKADAAAELLPLYNPFAEIISHNVMIEGVEQCKELIKDADIVTVGVDNLGTRIICQRAARELGIPCVTAGPMGWKTMCTTYMPDGLSYEDVICPEIIGKEITEEVKKSLDQGEKVFFGVSDGFTPDRAIEFLKGGQMRAIGFATNFAASYAINQIVKIIIKRGKVNIFPEMFTCDMFSGKEWNLNERGQIAGKIGKLMADGNRDEALKLFKDQLTD
jgi:molybdopterin/thiamine biosynthesis adenylyltransferase